MCRTAAASVAVGFLLTYALGVGFAELLDGDGLAGVGAPVTAFLVAHHARVDAAVHRLTDLGGLAMLAPLTGLLAALIAPRAGSWRPVRR